MASFGHQMHPHAAPRHAPQAGHGTPVAAAPGVVAPAGTFTSGTKIQVGGHRVVIQKYLSEGGFAHVYLVKLPKPIDGTDQAVLKRVAVPDKEALRSMRTEVETMKRLKGHRPIVTYIDSHASELRGGGYEVFLLMEFCNGGGLIDFMNTRLQHRLTEPEILHIFSDIAEGVACMHYLKPPLLHRDLKVENVLITSRGSSKRFKLCDFGSAASPRAAPTTVVECRLMDEDIQKHTTLQYRSPEMVDVYRKQPMDEKCDIWALGVLLYKLCYYTTPFEDQGQLAILNASYRYPSQPMFSDRLKKLIASMLKESMQARPTIYQVVKEACAMQGREVPIQDIYAGRAPEPRNTDKTSKTQKPQPAIGAVFSPEPEAKPAVPTVAPMRRGRPGTSPNPSQQAPRSNPPSKPPAPRPSPSPKITEGDPFAALDSRNVRQDYIDDASARFPSLDQFSLLHDQGAKFNFDSPAKAQPAQPSGADLNQRVTDRLADQAFVPGRQSPQKQNLPSRPHSVTPAASRPSVTSPPAEAAGAGAPSAPPATEMSRARSIISGHPELRAISSNANSSYVSTGTMTTDSPVDRTPKDADRLGKVYGRDDSRPPGVTRQADQSAAPHPRVSSFQPQSAHGRTPSASRASLETSRPQMEPSDSTLRPSVPGNRARPASTNFEPNTLDFLRDRESSRPQSRLAQPSPLGSPSLRPSTDDEGRLDDVKYAGSDDPDLKDPEKAKSKRLSLTSLSGSKNMLAGKFGDAFKRFEASNSDSNQGGARASSPSKDPQPQILTPIAGSEATDGRSDDGRVLDEDSMTPEMRREVERRQLLEEEARVEAAQAEYRRRKADGGTDFGSAPLPRSVGGVPRAVSIQNRVQNLLSEEQKPSDMPRTAEGYGKYTDAAAAPGRAEKALPEIPRKPLSVSKTRTTGAPQNKGPVAKVIGATPARSNTTPAAAAAPASARVTGKPAAPKKPTHLNSLPTGGRPASPQKRSEAPAQEQLVAVDLPGQPALPMTARERDDYLEDFSKRFPSLSSIEMVERDIGQETGGSKR